MGPMTASPDALEQMIENLDEKHGDSHKRMRDEVRDIKAQLDLGLQSLRAEQAAQRLSIAEMKATPMDATKLVVSPKTMIGVAIMTLSIAGTIWGSTAGLRSDVRDILTRQEAQKTAVEAAAKIQEVQSSALKTAVESMQRRQELQQYEIQSLKEAILGKR